MSNTAITPDAVHGEHGHEDHGHGHHPFQAHHFDDTQQQYDAGKLGIWLFLVTEVLFFSGMFCAYALYRARNPEVFTFASQFLNANLGAFNTCVLLFSSLTMAWAVRCAQLRQQVGLVLNLAITIGCAALFLGVKAVEYTHKWDMQIFPGGYYVPQFSHVAHHAGVSPWLYKLSAIPALLLVAFAVWFVMTRIKGEKRHSAIAASMLFSAALYFVGVGVGIGFQNAEASSHDEHADTTHVSATHSEGGEHAAEGHDHAAAGSHQDAAAESHAMTSVETVPAASHVSAVPGAPTIDMIDQPGGAGIFFSIYYCMTGVHAVHILAGMGVLTWLLVRATRNEFDEEYFGPVDYVGLYWHIVDLIWIYLFPLLYLIK